MTARVQKRGDANNNLYKVGHPIRHRIPQPLGVDGSPEYAAEDTPHLFHRRCKWGRSMGTDRTVATHQPAPARIYEPVAEAVALATSASRSRRRCSIF